jgi:hypothetical protein
VSGLNISPIRVSAGAMDLSSSPDFPITVKSIRVKPVMLPPGRARLATKPCATGSFTATNTSGIVEVARFIAAVATEPEEMISPGRARQFRGDLAASLGAAARRPQVDLQIVAVGPAELLERETQGSFQSGNSDADHAFWAVHVTRNGRDPQRTLTVREGELDSLR